MRCEACRFVMEGIFISSTAQPFCKIVVIGIYVVKAFETGARCSESESKSIVEGRGFRWLYANYV